jgi:hypothetical protein
MDKPRKDGHRMFVTEEDTAGVYGFCEICSDHHDMVLYRRDGAGLDTEPRIFPSKHAWTTWRKGTYIFRSDGV